MELKQTTRSLKKDFIVGLTIIFMALVGLGQVINDGGIIGLITQVSLIVFALVVILLPTELLLRKVWGVSLMDFVK